MGVHIWGEKGHFVFDPAAPYSEGGCLEVFCGSLWAENAKFCKFPLLGQSSRRSRNEVRGGGGGVNILVGQTPTVERDNPAFSF